MSEEIREELSDALSLIDRPGSFCTSGSTPPVLPGLEVEGLGPVGLPVTQKQAKELIKYCKQAPYGKGEKTLVDRSVRRVWRMASDRFSLTNPDWDQFIKTTVGQVQEALGLEKQKLESHLYDLLLYEPGSFFLPHRDGEKLNRMVATLIVVLPSNYEGGELVVRHDGREETIDLRGADANPFHTHFAAFYADCEHEVRPLRKGYRLCLVYNLVLAKSKQAITAPRESEHVAQIGELLREWAADDTAGKLVITLDHQYTEAGLSWDALKGVDRAKAKILSQAAQQADCKAYLALLTFHESGSADYAGGGRYSRTWGRYGDYDSGNADDYKMGEVFESSLTAKSWSDSEGQPLPIGELTILEEELLDPEALKEIDPEEEFEGYTGNAGMTLDHWYRHASIVIWPLQRHFEILCERNGKNAIPELERMVAELRQRKPSDAPALRTQCLELARAIFKTWREDRYDWSPDKSKPTDFLQALAVLDDPGLIGAFFRELLVRDPKLEIGKGVVTVCEKHGWATFQSDLKTVMEATTKETLDRNVYLLEQICSAKPRKKTGWSELCKELAKAFVAALKRIDRGDMGNEWRPGKVDRAELLAGLARSHLLTGQTDLLADVVAHALAASKQYPLATTHIPALRQLRLWLKKNQKQPNSAVSGWLASCREQLESLTAKAPEAPKDFRRARAAKITCECSECAELKRFLNDPRDSVHRLRARQERRDHLANIIRNSQCDLDLTTETRGSPHTLICTKNLASFHKKVKTYQENQEHLATVRAIEASLPKGSAKRG